MEITKLNIISDFEAAGIKCLQNPSLFPSLSRTHQLYSFWKWGAFILAIFATFAGIIKRIKLFIIRLRTIKSFTSSSSSITRLQPLDDDDSDFSDDDDTSSSVEESDDEEFESTRSYDHQKRQNQYFDENFCVAGTSNYLNTQLRKSYSKLRRRLSSGDLLSWANATAGGSVVKLWESTLGLGLDFNDSSQSKSSIRNLDKDEEISSILGGKYQVPAVAMSSPAVIYLAEPNNSDRISLSAYDRRMGRRIPAAYADWGPWPGKLVSISSGGVEKVYVRGDAGEELTAGDLRNIKTPVYILTESDGDVEES